MRTLLAGLPLFCLGHSTSAFATMPGRVGLIAFDNGGSISTVAPDGSGRRFLVSGQGADWSPDGTKVAYWILGSGVWVADADGLNRRRVSTTGVAPSWSRQGDRLVFSIAGNMMRVVRVSDGAMLGEFGPGRFPTWSPTEDTIAYAAPQQYQCDFGTGDGLKTYNGERLRVVNPDGSGGMDLTDDTCARTGGIYYPDWSPDGSMIVFQGYPRLNGFTRSGDVFVVPAGGGDPTNLTLGWTFNPPTGFEDQGFDPFEGFPSFSPDGTQIAFASNVDGFQTKNIHDLWVMNPNGGGAQRLALGSDRAYDVDWGSARPPLRASFTVTRTGPGRYQLVSTSVDPDGGPLVYEWTLGDGTSGAGAATSHTYAKPGRYTVTHTVTDVGGRRASVTQAIDVAAPALAVAIDFPGTSVTDFKPDEELAVRVIVSAGAEGVGALSDLVFATAPLLVDPGDRLTLVSGPMPVPAGALSLDPGQSVAFTYRLRAATLGAATLSSEIAGKDAAGRAVGPATATRQIRIRQETLRVTVTADPAAVELEDDESGPVPRDVAVRVTVTNVVDRPVTNVTLQPLDLRSRRLPAPVPPALVVKAGPFNPAGPDPDAAALGTLLPGVPVERLFTLEARDDGHYDVAALVQAADPNGGPTLIERGVSDVQSSGDVVLYYESEAAGVEDRGGALWKVGGLSWRVLGTLENRSSDKTILVILAPQLSGNAFYALPIIDGSSAPDSTCAIGTVRRMEKGEKLTFSAPVRTLEDGGTRGIVRLVPKAFIENDDGTRTALSTDQLLIKSGSTEHLVRVDVSVAPPREASTGEVIGGYLVGTIDGLGRFAEGIVALADLAVQALAFNFQPWLWPEAYRVAGDKVAGYLVDIYENLSPADKVAYTDSVVSAVLLSTGMALTEVRDLVDAAVLQRFTTLETAYYAGDSMAVAQWWGELTGENPDLALQLLVSGYGLCKLAHRGAGTVLTGLERKAASQAATLEARVAEGARGLRNADLLEYEAHLRGIFGVDRVSDRMFRQLAETWNIMVVIRRRGVGVLDKLRTGRFTLKPFGVKAKNVHPLDSDWLDFPSSRLDEVVIAEPPPWAEVQARLRGQPAEVVAEVQERWATRWKEWYGKGADPVTGAGGTGGERAKWLEYERDGVPYSKQSVAGIEENIERGFSVPTDDTQLMRKGFRIERTTGPNGRQVWRCEIEDRIKGWQGVTGDIDPMAFLRPDGTPLPAEARVKLYRALRHLGFQHPETLTWQNVDGLKAYLDEFSVHNPNSEALAAYMPDGTVRATRFDPGKSWVNPLDRNGAGVFLRGAATMVRATEPTPLDTAGLEAEVDRAAPVYVAPDTWTLVRPGCPGGTTQALGPNEVACPIDVTFTNDADGLVLRQSAIGMLEQWTPEAGWQPFTTDGTSVRVRPQTSLAAAAPAGSQRLEINELADLGLPPAANAWFAPGQQIVVNPGGANQEGATVVGLGSLLLAAPLRYDHDAGELVTVMPTPRTTTTVVTVTTTTLPTRPSTVDRFLSGRRLLLQDHPRKPQVRRLEATSTDKAQLDLGGDVPALLAAGGSLRLRAMGGDGFDATIPLPAGGWAPLDRKKPAKGIRFRGRGTVRTLVIKPGKTLLVKGRGVGLGFTLGQEPGIVQLEVTIGDRRLCLEFPPPGKFTSGKRLVRTKAQRARECPDLVAGRP